MHSEALWLVAGCYMPEDPGQAMALGLDAEVGWHTRECGCVGGLFMNMHVSLVVMAGL